MHWFLLIACIFLVLLTICSGGISALFLVAYLTTQDGTASMAHTQFTAFIICAVLAVLFLAGSILIFKRRKKLIAENPINK